MKSINFTPKETNTPRQNIHQKRHTYLVKMRRGVGLGEIVNKFQSSVHSFRLGERKKEKKKNCSQTFRFNNIPKPLGQEFDAGVDFGGEIRKECSVQRPNVVFQKGAVGKTRELEWIVRIVHVNSPSNRE